MATRLGTYLGTNLGTSQGTGEDGVSELATLQDYLARNLFSWMRTDAYATPVSGKIPSYPDCVYLPANGGLANNARSIDPNHAFSQATAANQTPTPAVQAAWNGCTVATFAGLQWYDSTLPLANWGMFHKAGLAAEVSVAFAPTDLATTSVLATTRISGIGMTHYFTAPNLYAGYINNVMGSSQAGLVLNAPTYTSLKWASASTPAWELRLKAVLASSGAASSGPSAANPEMTMRVGSDSSFACNAQIADIMFANQDSPTLRAAIQRYRALRYFP